jgi:hypothetical protein
VNRPLHLFFEGPAGGAIKALVGFFDSLLAACRACQVRAGHKNTSFAVLFAFSIDMLDLQ